MSLQLPQPGKTLAVNVDIDGLRFYRQIHGLESAKTGKDPIWEHGVPRFVEFFADLNLRATFFVVAEDLVPKSKGGAAPSIKEAQRRKSLLRSMRKSGHEIASHSFAHDYALSRGHYREIYADLERAKSTLSEVCGEEVTGFRAPGYNLSPALISAITETGYHYSSSRFPSPPYFLAKWATMAGMAMLGRSSGAIRGEILAPLSSRSPYQHDSGLWELPMSVVPLLRLPAIGTFFTLYGAKGQSLLLPLLKSEDWLNIEFHAIDLLDLSDLALDDPLGSSQPDLAKPGGDKKSIFLKWLGELSTSHENRTLGEVTEGLAR